MSSLPHHISEETEKRLRRVVWVVTGLVFVLVGLMRNPAAHIELPAGWSFDFLPPLYSTFNALVAGCLVSALICVKRGNIVAHQRLITAAMVLSGLFLLGYVAYHFTSTETKFTGTGWVRPVYFLLLVSHIALAALSLPFILLAYLAGWANRRAAHRRMVRWVFPVWLYVAVTGPVVYLMLYVWCRS